MRRRAMLLVVAMVGALVVGSGVALAASVTCTTNPCLGTSRADIISGTPDPETIQALAGNDLVKGRDGNDELHGDEGNDLVDGLGGNDTIYGGPDGDGSADGTDFGDIFITNLEGSEDSDIVYGGGGNDFIDAAANDMPLESQTEPVDSSYGGGGNDRIYAVDRNVDIIDCGKGTRDRAFIDASIDTNIKGCEKVFQAVTPRAQ